MTFDYPGYNLKFIQRKPCNDGTAHQFSLIYKFFSPATKYFYVLSADYHSEEVFAIKFYCKKDKKSDFKYSKIVNRGDLGNILITCAKVIPLLLKEYPSASFGFGAARTIDVKSGTVENYENNQRFRTYSYFAPLKFGEEVFIHIAYPTISCYLLINKSCTDIKLKEKRIKKMFIKTYNDLPDI